MRALFERLDRYWFAPVPAERLALVRFVTGCYAFVHFSTQLPQQLSFNRFHPASFKPVGLVALLGVPVPAGLHVTLVSLSLGLALAFAAGYRYRWIGPVFAALALWLGCYRSSWGMIFHTENLLVMHLLVLGFAPAAAALSLDSHRRPVPEPDARYGWPLRLMSALTTIAYCIAGIAKLRNGGISWVRNETLRNAIADNNLRKYQLGVWHSPIGAYLVRFAGLWKALALLTVAFELLAPLALLHPLAAKVWVVVCWSFHAGVLATMAILFGYPLSGVAFASFFELERHWPWRQALRRTAVKTTS